ncbi:MAG: hypothetical protein EOP06_00625 [Proteobacteria bacterium]|nr:MAG: hypothetical protein EOP06_00625 [Pseudomonadota bacterium]
MISDPQKGRIAVLGRSYEMGTGVADDETWPYFLENDFYRGKFEVLNFGVEAYSWVQIEATFHRFAKNFQPRCVLIPIFYEEIDSYTPLEAPPLPSGWRDSVSALNVAENFYLPRFIQQLFWWSIYRHGSTDWNLLSRPVSRSKVSSLRGEHITSIIQRLSNATQKTGAHVVFVPMPRLVKTSDKLYRIGRNLLEIYQTANPSIHVAREMEDLQGTVTIHDIAIPGDPHLDPDFNRKIASKVHDALQNIPDCSLSNQKTEPESMKQENPPKD